MLTAVNFAISLALISVLFGAIYKVLPDKQIAWGDVTVGAIVTAFLFTIGKTAIGLYLGRSHIASSYGGASAFVIILLWIYYSSQIFLLGAEFTRVYAESHGSHAGEVKAPASAIPAKPHAVAATSAARRPARRLPWPLLKPDFSRSSAGARQSRGGGATFMALGAFAFAFVVGDRLSRRREERL